MRRPALPSELTSAKEMCAELSRACWLPGSAWEISQGSVMSQLRKSYGLKDLLTEGKTWVQLCLLLSSPLEKQASRGEKAVPVLKPRCPCQLCGPRQTRASVFFSGKWGVLRATCFTGLWGLKQLLLRKHLAWASVCGKRVCPCSFCPLHFFHFIQSRTPNPQADAASINRI